eukprot:6488647-Pyramimonas_sp.AAC.1
MRGSLASLAVLSMRPLPATWAVFNKVLVPLELAFKRSSERSMLASLSSLYWKILSSWLASPLEA